MWYAQGRKGTQIKVQRLQLETMAEREASHASLQRREDAGGQCRRKPLAVQHLRLTTKMQGRKV